MDSQHTCAYCKKTVSLFYSVRYTDRVGWCSQECLEKGKKAEKEARRKKIMEERARLIQQSTRAPYFPELIDE